MCERDDERNDRRREKPRKPKKARMGGMAVTFCCCVLGVPTCCKLLPGLTMAEPLAAVQAGVLLGVAYLLLRPILKILTLPIGCLTMGVFNFAIDVGLLYASSYFIEGFAVESLTAAIGTALLINGVSGVAGGFRQR